MRALSGAIIVAAALIALGLTAEGIGTRYNWVRMSKPAATDDAKQPSLKTIDDVKGSHVKIHEMDNGLILCLTLSVLGLFVGLGITFVGLMYHHHRRFHEHLRLHGQHAATTGHHVTS